MDEDYKQFCLKCGWLDEDYGCVCPSGEEVWECPMYIHYHHKVEELNRQIEEWKDKNAEK